MGKINIKIESPQLSVDATMSEAKGLAYLKRVKKIIEKDIRVVIKKIEENENKRK